MKRSFFQAAVTSILLYGCTTWTLTKRLEKKLDGNYTRMLRAILNKSWWQHPTRHQLYGHPPPITKTIQVTRTRHTGHCWRSRDELIRDVLLWTPTHGRAKAGRPARTYIQQLCEDMGYCPEDLPRAMNDGEEWRERVRDIRATSATWWWWLLSNSFFNRNNCIHLEGVNQEKKHVSSGYTCTIFYLDRYIHIRAINVFTLLFWIPYYIYIYIYIFVCVCVCVCVCDNVKRFSNVCLKSVKCSNTDGCWWLVFYRSQYSCVYLMTNAVIYIYLGRCLWCHGYCNTKWKRWLNIIAESIVGVWFIHFSTYFSHLVRFAKNLPYIYIYIFIFDK